MKIIKRLKKIRLVVYLVFTGIYALSVLGIVMEFLSLGSNLPFGKTEIDTVISLFGEAMIGAFILIIFMFGIIIFCIISLVYFLVWYFIISSKEKKLKNEVISESNEVK